VTTVEAQTLADYLGNEHPQVAAVVLSQLFADYAAQVLSQLPAASAADIMVRLLEVSPVNREILDDIERALRNDLGMDLVQDKKKDPHNYMADLLDPACAGAPPVRVARGTSGLALGHVRQNFGCWIRQSLSAIARRACPIPAASAWIDACLI